jgi:hypothetical protein
MLPGLGLGFSSTAAGGPSGAQGGTINAPFNTSGSGSQAAFASPGQTAGGGTTGLDLAKMLPWIIGAAVFLLAVHFLKRKRK